MVASKAIQYSYNYEYATKLQYFFLYEGKLNATGLIAVPLVTTSQSIQHEI